MQKEEIKSIQNKKNKSKKSLKSLIILAITFSPILLILLLVIFGFVILLSPFLLIGFVMYTICDTIYKIKRMRINVALEKHQLEIKNQKNVHTFN